MSGAALEARLRRVEDELAIRRILADYTAFLDARDYDSYVALFAEQGEWTNHGGRFTGRAAIRAMLEQVVGPPGNPSGATYHLNSNERVDVEGDRATAVSRFLFMMRSPENRPVPALAGLYRDEFVREAGHWKIARRVAQDLIPTPEQMAQILAARQAAL